MKTTTVSVFLLFIFSITHSSCLFGVANAAHDAVLDVDGDQILVGNPYYVVSAIWGAGGGGLAIGRESGRMCPKIVVQRRVSIDRGNPVFFSNTDSSGVVRVSSDVRVKFVGPRDRLCLTSMVWKVQGPDESSGKRWLELGGSEGEPGCDSVKSWFKIETTNFPAGSYTFKYCPSVCDSSETSCSGIARSRDADGQMRLALSDTEGYSWPWVFMKAYGKDTRIRQVVGA